MSDKPSPDIEIIRALSDFHRRSPDERFVAQLHWRARGLLEQDRLPRTAITLEMLQSAFSAFENGMGHAEISDAYPVEAWREDTVEVPRAWLRVLVEGWEKYKSAPKGSNFGEAFGVEGGGQGQQPVRAELNALNQELRLSGRAIAEYLAERAQGGVGSWERAYHTAAEAEGVSADTVKRATAKHRPSTLAKARYLGLLDKGGKAS